MTVSHWLKSNELSWSSASVRPMGLGALSEMAVRRLPCTDLTALARILAWHTWCLCRHCALRNDCGVEPQEIGAPAVSLGAGWGQKTSYSGLFPTDLAFAEYSSWRKWAACCLCAAEINERTHLSDTAPTGPSQRVFILYCRSYWTVGSDIGFYLLTRWQ